jgi:hypothetical protein
MSEVAAALTRIVELTRAELAALTARDAAALSAASAAKAEALGALAAQRATAASPELTALIAEARSLTDAVALRLRLLAAHEARRRAAMAGGLRRTA